MGADLFWPQGHRQRLEDTILYPSRGARDAAFQTGMKEGVSLSFDRLAEYLRTMA